MNREPRKKIWTRDHGGSRAQAWLCMALWARPAPRRGLFTHLQKRPFVTSQQLLRFKIFFVKKTFVQIKPSWEALYVKQSSPIEGVGVPEAPKIPEEHSWHPLAWLILSVLWALVFPASRVVLSL